MQINLYKLLLSLFYGVFFFFPHLRNLFQVLCLIVVCSLLYMIPCIDYYCTSWFLCVTYFDLFETGVLSSWIHIWIHHLCQ